MTRKDLILKAAFDAGKIISSITPSTATLISKEGRGNYVTMADKASEQIIFTLIRESFPEDCVLSEETATNLTQKELMLQDHLWIIDPIDGTANYQHRRKYSCVSIGYAERGILKHAVVYDPFREELFSAERGKGAWHNGAKMKVSETRHISHSVIITDNSYDPTIIRRHLETILKIPETPWIMMKGSFALELCEVANGQADIVFSYCPKPWDNAAGFLIVNEAGGECVDLEGNEINFFSENVVAGNPNIVKEFLRIVNS